MKKIIPVILLMLTYKVYSQNVGIGTTSPAEILHVDSTIKIGKNLPLPIGSLRKNLVKFGDGNFVSIGEELVDDKMYLRYGDLILQRSTGSAGSGYIGVNTETPSAHLDVNGTFRLRGNGAAKGKVLTTDANGYALWDNNRLSLPASYILDISPADTGFSINNTGTTGLIASFINDNAANIDPALYTRSNSSAGTLYSANYGSGAAGVFYAAGDGNAIRAFTSGTGYAFSGTSFGDLAEFRKQVSFTSSVRVARIDVNGKGFFNGGTQTGGADVAEAFAVEGERKSYEPGDVLAISTSADRTVVKSNEAYSTLVVGVYATKPGVLLTERMEDDSQADLVPMGVIGVIPTKVCNEGGPIHRGDLLVTSSISGRAMKATEGKIKFGSVIGKALEDFTEGKEGKINVLVNVK